RKVSRPKPDAEERQPVPTGRWKTKHELPACTRERARRRDAATIRRDDDHACSRSHAVGEQYDAAHRLRDSRSRPDNEQPRGAKRASEARQQATRPPAATADEDFAISRRGVAPRGAMHQFWAVRVSRPVELPRRRRNAGPLWRRRRGVRNDRGVTTAM